MNLRPGVPWAAALLALGCGEATPPVPTAVVRTEPSSLCLHDDHATTVLVDGSESTASLTLVPAPPAADEPLELEWAFSGDAHQLLGEPSGVEVRLTAAGERPLHITLRVSHPSGGTATSLHTLPITLPAPAPSCAEAVCPTELECVEHGGQQICVPPEPCVFAADCPVCFDCDAALGRCLPRGGSR